MSLEHEYASNSDSAHGLAVLLVISMVILPPEPDDASDVRSDDDLPVESYTILLSEPKHESEYNDPDACSKGLLLSYIVELLVLDGP